MTTSPFSSGDVQPPYLYALADYVQPAVYALRPAQTECVLGRSDLCEVVIAHSLVSKAHARLERRLDLWLLTDLASTNGTFVNGARLTGERRLHHLDEIGLGRPEALLRFVDHAPTEHASALAAPTLRYDAATNTFFLDRQEVRLTRLQKRLLHYLYARAGQLCRREDLIAHLFDAQPEHVGKGNLDRLLTEVRAALRAAQPAAEGLVINQRGEGYRLHLTPPG